MDCLNKSKKKWEKEEEKEDAHVRHGEGTSNVRDPLNSSHKDTTDLVDKLVSISGLDHLVDHGLEIGGF